MLKHLLRAAALLAALAPAGCKRAAPPPLPPGVAPEDRSTRLGKSSALDVNHWLTLPRKDLAKLADEWTETVQKQLSAIRSNPQSVDLLPKVLPALWVPGFEKAAFSSQVGFSLPPYVEAGKKDAAVALHLARYGDHEAAARLAPDGLGDRLKRLRTEKNYPVEWTRLVGLTLYSSQLKLSLGDLDGVTQLVLLHRQLVETLDPKASAGPLGAALLPAGRNALVKAATAWREKRRNKIALAADIDKAVEEWGKPPAPTLALPFGAPAADVAALFATEPRGKAVFADTPAKLTRVMELLGLPVPDDGIQVVAAFLDADGKLAEWQVAYRSRIDTLYASPAHLAYRLSEAGFVPDKESRTANLMKQAFTAGGTVVEVVRTNRSSSLGGHVRIAPAKGGPVAASTRGLRDFGPVNFDRGFEANRLLVYPPAGGSPVVIRDAQAMKKMAKVLETPVPDTVVLLREKDADVLNVLEMAWPVADNARALDRLLPSLWDDYGPAKLADVEDPSGSYLGFVWEDKTTRVQVKLAYDERGPVLAARDTQPDDKMAARIAVTRATDEKERQKRLADGKSEERLSRSPGRVNDIPLAGLKLGQSKSEVEKVLPRGKSYRRKDLPDGVSITILTTPDKAMTYWARQLLIRFESGRVAELRLRYQRGPATTKKGDPLFQTLCEASGSPESLPAPWTGLWTDLAAPGKTEYFRWRDDRTVRSYQRDAGGMEVTLRDRSTDNAGLDATPWQFVSDGFGPCRLGDARQKVEAYFKAPATTSDGAEVYRTAPSSRYEMVLVWYEGERVVRILAAHRDRCGGTPKEVAAALNAVWGKDLDNLGYVTRQESERGSLLGAYYWHDDRVRVRASVRTTDAGPRIMTEWRYFPVKQRDE